MRWSQTAGARVTALIHQFNFVVSASCLKKVLLRTVRRVVYTGRKSWCNVEVSMDLEMAAVNLVGSKEIGIVVQFYLIVL